MNGGALVREARRRAGLTQAELAQRAGTTQSAIARLERGRTDPSYSRVTELILHCGFELQPHLVPADDSNWITALTSLELDVDGRVRSNQSALRFIRAGREAMERARGGA